MTTNDMFYALGWLDRHHQNSNLPTDAERTEVAQDFAAWLDGHPGLSLRFAWSLYCESLHVAAVWALPAEPVVYRIGYADAWFTSGGKIHAVKGAKGYRGETGLALCGAQVTVASGDFKGSDSKSRCKRCAGAVKADR
jgi:hypothetical protein